MPQYVGFSTQNANKPPTRNAQYGGYGGVGGIVNPVYTGRKFQLTDAELVLTDLVNALNIKEGEKVGQPSYGTRLWNFVFQPNTNDINTAIQNEIARMAGLDPRLSLQSVQVFPKDNGILIQLQAYVLPFSQAMTLSVFLDSTTNTASSQS